MGNAAARAEPTVYRRVFERWSVTIPAGMDETFLENEGYWHAWDARRSISLTSIHLSDRRGQPVPAVAILEQTPPMDGEAMPLPDDLPGWAVLVVVPDSPLASRAVSGIVVADGNFLIVTVTSDDLEWAQSIWRSIRYDAADARRRKLMMVLSPLHL